MKAEKEVDVIIHRVDDKGGAIEVFKDGGDVSMEFNSDFLADEWLAVFGAKNEMDDVFCE